MIKVSYEPFKQFAAASGLSYRRICKDSGLCMSTVRKLLKTNAAVSQQTITRLCEVYGLSIEDIQRMEEVFDDGNLSD